MSPFMCYAPSTQTPMLKKDVFVLFCVEIYCSLMLGGIPHYRLCSSYKRHLGQHDHCPLPQHPNTSSPWGSLKLFPLLVKSFPFRLEWWWWGAPDNKKPFLCTYGFNLAKLTMAKFRQRSVSERYSLMQGVG